MSKSVNNDVNMNSLAGLNGESLIQMYIIFHIFNYCKMALRFI